MSGGDYGRVRHTFWTDPDIKRVLNTEQKALLLYYFTSPHRNLIGLYYCPFAYVASETGLTIDRVEEWTLGPLAKFVSYDLATEEILVHRAGKHQIGEVLAEKDKQRTAVVKSCAEVHSAKLLRRFLELYRHWNLAVAVPPDPAPYDAPSKPLTRPSEAKAVAVTQQYHNTAAAPRAAPAPEREASPAPLNNGGGLADCVQFVEQHGYGARERLIAEGEDTTAWTTTTGERVPESDRLRLLRLADARVKDQESPNLRSALRYVILQQYDPTKGPTAADLAARNSATPNGSAPQQSAPALPSVREIEAKRDASAARYTEWRDEMRELLSREGLDLVATLRVQATDAIGELVMRALPASAKDRTVEAKMLELYGSRIGKPQPVAA